MKDLAPYYRILGLEVGASLEEINQAYRDLAFIWHPDRIPSGNERLLEKAIARLKDINHARDQLRQAPIHSATAPSEPKTEPKTKPKTEQQSDKTNTSSHSSRSNPPNPPKPPNPPEPSVQRPFHRDLSGADFRGANLREKDFSGRKLIQADLSHADLSDSF